MCARVRGVAAAFVLLAVVPAGCSGGIGSISGKVTVNGVPLPSGVISFHSEVGNREVFNASVRDGEYSIDGIPAGTAKVSVKATTPGVPGGVPGTSEAKDSRPGGGKGGVPLPPTKPAPGAVPSKYSDPSTSGLSLVVKAGNQAYPVDLTP